MDQPLEEEQADQLGSKNLREELYFWSILFLASILFIIVSSVSGRFWQVSWFDFALFLILNIIAEQTYVVLPQGSRISASFAIILTVLVLFNPPIGVSIAVLGALISMGLIKQRGWRVAWFNAAQYGVTYSLAGLLMMAVGERISGLLHPQSLPYDLVIGGAATGVYLLLNLPLVNTYLVIKQNPQVGWRELRDTLMQIKDDRIEVFQTLFFYPIAVLVAYSYYQERNPVIPVVLAFLVFGGLRFIEQRRKIERQREKNEVLYRLTKLMSESVLQEAEVELDPGHVFDHLFGSDVASIKNLITNQRTSVYRVETIGEERRIVHKKSDTLLEPEKIYSMEDKGFLQQMVQTKQGVRTSQMSQLGGAYMPWRVAYQSIMAQPILVDDEVNFILVMFRVAGDAFHEQDERILKLLVNAFEITLKNVQLRNRIQAQAIKDGLMGIFNHRYLKAKLEEEMNRSKRYQSPLSLIITDVDYFKKFNDTHGHLLGDKVLKDIAGILQDSVRETDIVARYGGEELAILLPETPLQAACEVAERIRRNVATHVFMGKEQQEVAMSLSIGVCCLDGELELEPSEMIIRTDTALYRAKHQGRNQICRAFLEGGRLVIETYARGHTPRPADEIQTPEGVLRKELLEGWDDQLEKSLPELNRSLLKEIRKLPPDSLSARYFEKKLLPVVPELLRGLVHAPLDDEQQLLPDSELAQILTRLDQLLSRRLYKSQDLQLLQTLLLKTYRHFVRQVLALAVSESERKSLFNRGFKLVIQIQQRLFASSMKVVQHQFHLAQGHYQLNKALLQLLSQSASGPTPTLVRNLLQEIQAVVDQAQLLFLARPHHQNGHYEVQASLPPASLPKSLRQLEHPELQAAAEPQLLELEAGQLSAYFQFVGELDSAYQRNAHWVLLPLWLQGQSYGLLGMVVSAPLSQLQRHWLVTAAHELADGLRLQHALPNAQTQQLVTLRKLVEVAQSATGSFEAERMVSLAVRMAQRLKLSLEQQACLRDAAYLSQIGKLLLPVVSQGPGAHRQPQILNQRLLDSLGLAKEQAQVVRAIEEHWDGSGFPEGLSGEQIPLLARILGLITAYLKRTQAGESGLDALEALRKTGYYDPSLCALLKEFAT